MKLLPSATTSTIIRPKTSVISASKLIPNSSNKKAEDQEKTVVIKEKLTTIAGLLEGTLASKKKEETDKKKKEQQERRGSREAKLEKKPKTKGKLELPKVPGMSFLDRIKQFLMNILGGYLLYKLVEFAPLLTPILTGIMQVGEWLIDFGGKILNAVVSFVDGAYAAYDWSREQVKNVFGEDAAKGFDQLSSNLNKLLNGALIAAMVAIKVAEGVRKATVKNAARRGFDNIKGVKGQAGRFSKGVSPAAARRYTDTYGRRAAIRRFGPDAVKSLGGRYTRSRVTNLGRAALVKGLGKGGVKSAAKILKPIVKNIPLIGGIMEFVLSWVSGDPIGKAAFRGIGTGLGTWLGGAIGTLFGPGIGTFIGGALGGAAGGELGGLLYDTIFTDKAPQSQPAEVQGRQEGGQIKPLDAPKKAAVKPNYTKGKQKVSPIKVDEKSKMSDATQTFNNIDYFGPILASATKIMSGEDLAPTDYKSIGAGFNNLLLKGFQDGKLKSNLAIGYNDGGIVSADSLKDAQIASANFSGWVGDTFKGEYIKQKPKLEQSVKGKKKKTTDGKPKTAAQSIEYALKSMLGISDPDPEPDSDDGSTDGPGSAATLRDPATGVPMTSAGQASGAVQSDGELVASMGFSAEDWDLFRNTVAQIESGGKYNISGGSNDHYDGRYQLGAAAKTDGARYAGVADPGHDSGAREAFRKDSELQEKLFAGFTKANHTYLMGVPEYKDSTPQRKLQILGYAHNQGMGGAENWMKTGVVGADGFGTKGTKYTDSIAAEFRKRSQKMQFGGEVNGQEGIDKVPAMLTSGEFVIDKDSTMAIQTAFPGFLSAVNKAEGQKAVEILMNYASYNDPTSGEIVVIDRKEVIAQAPMQTSSVVRPAPSGSSINFKEILSFVG